VKDTNGIQQVCFDPVHPGVGENLETLRWYGDFGAEIKCLICGVTVGCHVLKGKFSEMDRRFWIWHFEANHKELLTPKTAEGRR
jgi:hypothetical protein